MDSAAFDVLIKILESYQPQILSVIVMIEDFYFPVDFLLIDMKMTKELSQAPIILG